MKVLIDECMSWKVGRHLVGHACEGVARVGFAGMTNGALLDVAERAGFEVLLTVDQGFAYQQQMRGRKRALVVLHATSNKIEALLPHIPACIEALRLIRPGEVMNVGQ